MGSRNWFLGPTCPFYAAGHEKTQIHSRCTCSMPRAFWGTFPFPRVPVWFLAQPISFTGGSCSSELGPKMNGSSLIFGSKPCTRNWQHGQSNDDSEATENYSRFSGIPGSKLRFISGSPAINHHHALVFQFCEPKTEKPKFGRFFGRFRNRAL